MTRILGIDPGSLYTGYGVIEMDGNHARHISNGQIRVTGPDLAAKCLTIFNGIIDVIDSCGPDEIAIERVFMHRNADSALKLGQARGAAITACAERSLDCYEYAPNQIKQAVVGRGHATKQQVQHMVKVLLCLHSIPPADAADALAVALCHGHSREGLLRMKKITGMRRGRLQ